MTELGNRIASLFAHTKDLRTIAKMTNLNVHLVCSSLISYERIGVMFGKRKRQHHAKSQTWHLVDFRNSPQDWLYSPGLQ